MSTLLIFSTATSIAVTRPNDAVLAAHQNGQVAPVEGETRYIITGSEDMRQVPTAVLVQAYNAVRASGGRSPIKGFHDREKAEKKGSEALHVLATKNGEAVAAANADTPTQEGEPMATATKSKRTKKAKGAKRAAKANGAATRYRLINMEPTAKSKEDVKPARAGSKTAVMIDLLAAGATLPQLEKALSEKGKAVNARAWVTGFGRFGYGVKAQDEKAEQPVYQLVYPKGMRQPLPHRTPKSGEPE